MDFVNRLLAHGISGGDTIGDPAAKPAEGAGQPQLPEKFRGKSVEDIVNSYTELERSHGSLTSERDKLRGVLGEWGEFRKSWEPLLSQVDFDPAKFSAALEKQAGGEKLTRAEQRAVKRWAEIADPSEQEQYLHGLLEERDNQHRQTLEGVVKNLLNYVNEYGSKSIAALERKFSSPALKDVPVMDLVNDALKLASGKFDPIEWAAALRSYPHNMGEFIKKHDEELVAKTRAAVEAELNKRATTGVTGGYGGEQTKSRYQMPVVPTEQGGKQLMRSPSIQDARERFMARLVDINSKQGAG